VNIVQVPRRFVRSCWGGTETVVLETSRQLRALGHEVRIFCPDALADRARESMGGVEVERFPYIYPYWGLSAEARRQLDYKGGNLFSPALWRALLRLEGLDLVHLHTRGRLGGIVRRVARRRNIPYVVSLHGGVYDVPAEEKAALLDPTRGAVEWGKVLGWYVGSRRVLDDASAIICVGPEEQARVQERFPRKLVVYLPNGVEVARFRSGEGSAFRARHSIPAEARVIGVVARIDPQKNQGLLVDLLPSLPPDVHLLLVGHVTDPAYLGLLRGRIAAAGLAERVTLVEGLDGQGQDLVDAYHAADVVCLPSIHEPFGIAILEAWAAKRAVVAARVGGVARLVDEGRNGLLFSPTGEAGAELREARAALLAVLDDPALRASLAENGARAATAEYDWSRITAALLEVYERAAASLKAQRWR
jgi:glycosyltransferase involved in cell wall biosynthesis